uniref:Uncharacterized protein n=1 Tax=Anguilla anguilla TaxID=7936 RepID=A0A0E9SDF2_ANGAN
MCFGEPQIVFTLLSWQQRVYVSMLIHGLQIRGSKTQVGLEMPN